MSGGGQRTRQLTTGCRGREVLKVKKYGLAFAQLFSRLLCIGWFILLLLLYPHFWELLSKVAILFGDSGIMFLLSKLTLCLCLVYLFWFVLEHVQHSIVKSICDSSGLAIFLVSIVLFFRDLFF